MGDGSRRWVARGGTADGFESVVFWAVPAGIVGARVYHVLTHLGDYTGPDADNVFAIWEGGIAIYGAISGGALAAWVLARRRGLKFAALADAVAPGIAVAQAIGRFGTFHPTFLYEAGWNVLVAAVLVWADRRYTLGRGKVFALYLCLYGLGRIGTESLRLDYSYDTFGPLRFNALVAGLISLAGLALFLWLRRNRPGRETEVESPSVLNV